MYCSFFLFLYNIISYYVVHITLKEMSDFLDTSKSRQHKITVGLLVIYLFAMTWIILFKMQFSLTSLLQVTNFRSINLVPFAGTAVYDNQLHFPEIFYNILIFVPFGIYISILKPYWPFLLKLAPIAAVSLLFETLQYIFIIGGSDITDFLANTSGGVLGILIFLIFKKLFKNKATKLLILLAILGTVAVFVLGILIMLGVVNYEIFT